MNDTSTAQTTLSRRLAVQRALAGVWPGRVLRGELVIDDAFVRDFVGLEGDAIPWAARHAVLQRLRHDLAVVSFSHGWGSPVQPDEEEGAVRPICSSLLWSMGPSAPRPRPGAGSRPWSS